MIVSTRSTRSVLSLFFLASLTVGSQLDTKENGSQLNDADFVHNPQASAINGDAVKVEFFSTVEASDDYRALDVIRPLVMRMHGSAIDFDPKVVVTPGADIQCRQPDGSAFETLPSHCEEHCVVMGRYCDLEELEGIPSKSSIRLEKLDGVHHIHELATRRCVWLEYGVNHPSTYFKYFDSMLMSPHPCANHLSSNCLHGVFIAAGVDQDTIDQCKAGMNMHSDQAVPVLEQALQQPMPADLPALFVNGIEVADYDMTALQNLEYVCAAFDGPHMPNKPLVCDFCLSHCPEQAGASDIRSCLWDLKCTDDSTFNQYLEQKGIAVEFPETETPTTTDAPGTTQDNSTDSAAATTAEASSASKEGLGIALSILVALLVIFALLVGVYAVRIQRSRAVIDQYLKSKAQLEVMSHPAHFDHAFFPTEDVGDHMMDLDGDIPQYTDHVSGMSQRGCTAAPKQSSFLPEIQ